MRPLTKSVVAPVVFTLAFALAQATALFPVYARPRPHMRLYTDLHTDLHNPATPPTLAGCPMFPANNIWNVRVDTLSVHARSAAYIDSIGSTTSLHADFGTFWEGAPIGIPYAVVVGTQPLVPIVFDRNSYGEEESDPGPYPIPPNVPIEGGPASAGDRHVLVVNSGNCRLYELFDAHYETDGAWHAGSGAVFDLRANALRPAGWTSADAAGLPILPGLVRYDEVMAGEITHAIRFTAQHTQGSYVWPARHEASSITDLNVPPMGQRFRLKASKDISGYPAQIQVIFRAFKRYGIILADNGSNWYVSGTHDPRWDDETLGDAFRTLKGSDFEAVDVSRLMMSADVATARSFVYVPAVMR